MSAEIIPFVEPIEQPDRTAFCLTPTAQDMIQLIEHVAAHPGWFGLIIGDPGVGKTTTLRHLTRAHSDIALVTLGAANAGIAPVLRAVGEALGALPDHRLHTSCLHDAICARLSDPYRMFGLPWRVVLVDEAQQATPAALEALRGIVDEAQIPMVLAGNRQFPQLLNKKYRGPLFEPLLSRVLMKRDFSKPTAGDLKAVLTHWGIEDERILDVIEQHVFARGGGLRTAQIVVDWAQELAGPGTPIKYQNIKQAVKIHGGAL